MKRHKLSAEELLATRLALTVTETSRLLGISGASVRSLLRQGRLKGISFGNGTKSKSFVISVQALLDFLAGQ